MLQETDLHAVKEVVRNLLYTDVHLTEIPFIISHPIFSLSSTYVPGVEKALDLLNEDDLDMARKHFLDVIDKADLLGLYMIIRTPYKLAFLKFAMDAMSVKDFSRYLADAWVIMENPNQDANCTIPFIIKMFKKADKKELMTSEDYGIFVTLPEQITVYRGVAVGRNPKGLSWTDDYKKAEWFANRYNNDKKVGYIQKAVIDKKDVLAYFNTRGEKELVCDIRKTKIERL